MKTQHSPKTKAGGGEEAVPTAQLWEERTTSGKREWEEMSSGTPGWVKVPTKGGDQCKVLQHHITVQEFLEPHQGVPTLWGEVNGHAPKGHT